MTEQITKNDQSISSNETTAPEFDELLNNQLVSTLNALKSGQAMPTAICIASLDIQPKDEVEKMIIAQMISAFSAAMKCMSDAWELDDGFAFNGVSYAYSPEVRNQFMRTACQLTRTYCDLAHTLNKHRGKVTDQKITVQYVQVNNAS
jgi:hypothetical protein